MAIRDIVQAAAGNVGESLYVEDVFSTYLYTATGANQTITNNIDLSGEGGMLWIKDRTTGGTYPVIVDTARGANKWLATSQTFGQQTSTSSVTSFTSSGFTLGADNGSGDNNSVNYPYTSPTNLVSWSFRKTEKFFDVVTYTGNDSSNRQISHNLGSTPGCIIVKCTSGGGNWAVYHQSVGNTKALYLNTTTTGVTASTFWNNTDPTSTNFTVGSGSAVNTNGETYVAYLFAHEAGGFGDAGDQSVVSCGSYTGNGSATGPQINLGWEVQWLLVKSTTASGSHWYLMDNMRGMGYIGAYELYPNLDASDTAQTKNVVPTATGFQVVTTDGYLNQNGGTYVYIAIRRGPMKTPEVGTTVFSPNAINAATGTPITTNFPVDLQVIHYRPGVDNVYWMDRLRGVNTPGANALRPYLFSDNTNAETTANSVSNGWNNTGFNISSAFNSGSYICWNFRRAPGFFDEVCYTGNDINRTINHNLGVAPEMMIIKNRDSVLEWAVYHSGIGNTKYLWLNSTAAEATASTYWNNTTPTSSVFTVGTSNKVNSSPSPYVAYLFASCPGVSSVGSVNVTGSTINVNCGFTSGARFVVLKRSSGTSPWLVWDTARGIIAGDDPYVALNSTAAENFDGTADLIDPYSPGFTIVGGTFDGLFGTGTFIYLAIA